MNRITLAIAVALTLVFSLISFTEACANDFRSLLSELNFSKQTTSSRQLLVANPRSATALRPAPGTATLQAPIVGHQHAAQNSAMSASSAIGQMKSRSGDVSANSVGHRMGGLLHTGSNCDCDACDACPAPRKRLQLPKLKCKSRCGSGCGEIIDAPCGCCNGCNKGCCLGRLKKEKHVEQKVCMPRTEVNLPSSTMRQYFRSNRCATNIWDGYSQECGDNHKHIHGTCDCGTKKKRSCLSGRCGGGCGEILPPRQACNDCGSCDASCDSGCCR